MSEVACAYEVQPFDFCETGNFVDAHSLACCSTVTAVNVQVGDYSDLNHVL
jgi:hypothetical protein